MSPRALNTALAFVYPQCAILTDRQAGLVGYLVKIKKSVYTPKVKGVSVYKVALFVANLAIPL